MAFPPRKTPVGVRIIAGRFRGHKLHYSGDPRTRPMKDRVRQALFNRLGPDVEGKLAIDLFAGTGALGLEALSRGAHRVILIEQHRSTVGDLQRSVETLGVSAEVTIVHGDAFLWHLNPRDPGKKARLPAPPSPLPALRPALPAPCSPLPALRPHDLGEEPWLVFCSPPYDFYVERAEAMLELLDRLIRTSPQGSVFAVEADRRFDFRRLADPDVWDLRTYPPAVVGIFRKYT